MTDTVLFEMEIPHCVLLKKSSFQLWFCYVSIQENTDGGHYLLDKGFSRLNQKSSYIDFECTAEALVFDKMQFSICKYPSVTMMICKSFSKELANRK